VRNTTVATEVCYCNKTFPYPYFITFISRT